MFYVCLAIGSPFTVRVTGEGRIRESITRRQKAASVASVGSVCDLSLKIPGTHTHSLSYLTNLMASSVSHRCWEDILFRATPSVSLLFLTIFILFYLSFNVLCPNQLSFLPSPLHQFFLLLSLSTITPSSFPPLPSVSWFLLVLSPQLLSHTTFRSYCSLWWSGRSGARRVSSSAVIQDQRLSPGHVRLISGLSGLMLTGAARASRGIWVVNTRSSVGNARVEGAL